MGSAQCWNRAVDGVPRHARGPRFYIEFRRRGSGHSIRPTPYRSANHRVADKPRTERQQELWLCSKDCMLALCLNVKTSGGAKSFAVVLKLGRSLNHGPTVI